jgi:hypothetical protein
LAEEDLVAVMAQVVAAHMAGAGAVKEMLAEMALFVLFGAVVDPSLITQPTYNNFFK